MAPGGTVKTRLGPVVAVLMAAMALAAIPPVAMGVLAPFLIADLEFTRAGIGALVAVSSGVSALLSPLAGLLVDRAGDRAALLVVLGTGVAGLAAMAAASSWIAMGLALALGGVCRAGCNPATNLVISSRVARGGRGWITGIKQSGETLAIVVAAGLLPAVALAVGWRGALLALTLAACPALVVAMGVLGPAPVTRGAAPRGGVRPALYWLAGYTLVMGAGDGCLIVYLPLYAHESVGLPIAAAGGVMVVAGLVATVCLVAWSRVAEGASSTANVLVRLALLALFGTVVLLAAPSVGEPALWLGAALCGAGGLAFGSVSMLAVMEESDGAGTGKGTGLVVFAFGVGATLAPPVFGWLVDHSTEYWPGMLFVALFYVMAAAVMLGGRGHFVKHQ